MNRLNKFLLLICFSLLSACSVIQSFHSQSPEYIEILIKEKHYSKAQNILQHISPAHPDYATMMAQKKRLHALTRKLETSTLEKSQSLREQDKWQQALHVLQDARAQLPKSEVLIKAEQAFLAARKKRINKLNMQLDIHKGIWLRDAEPLLDTIVRTMPDDYQRQQQRQLFSQEKAHTLKNLVRCADDAMDKELYETGRHCLALVNRIDNEHKYTKDLKSATLKLQRHDYAWHQQQSKVSDELLKELKQGYSHDNLLRASQHLQKLSSHTPSDFEQQYSTQLKLELEKGIAQNMNAGRQLYSEGKITEALSIWISLRKITPDNEALEAHISRAQRVLEKLEQLGKRGSKVSNAPPPE